MNDVRAFRKFWEEVTSRPVTMTVRDMALTSHNLSKSGDIATLKDGTKFVWDNDRKLWSKYQ